MLGQKNGKRFGLVSYLEKHRHVCDLGAREHVEAVGPCQVLLRLVAEVEGADAKLEGSKFLDLKLHFLVPLLNRVVFIVLISVLNIDA